MAVKYKQRGYNSLFPNEIEVWKYGEEVPEWLSDRARIKFVDGYGNAILDLIDNTKGGYEIKDSSGTSVLARTTSREDYICFEKSSGTIFSLTPIQLKLLYVKEYEN